MKDTSNVFHDFENTLIQEKEDKELESEIKGIPHSRF